MPHRAWWRQSLPFLLLVAFCFAAYVRELLRSRAERAREDWFEFDDTEEEIECFNGTIENPQFENCTSEHIPKVVHFIRGLHHPGNDTTHPTSDFVAYLAIRAALISLKPDQIKLHYSYLNEKDPWLPLIKDHVTLVYHEPQVKLTDLGNIEHPSHLADILRLQILYEEGGIYLDSDVFALKSFDHVLRGGRDVVLGHEGGKRHGLCNGIIVARKQSVFIKRWLDAYDESFRDDQWNLHSVLLPKVLSKFYPHELCVLSPTTFFWPLWTPEHLEYMHGTLSGDETAAVEEAVEMNGGGLHPNQLAYHAWNQVASVKYLHQLNQQSILKKNTRFNIMMRGFLEVPVLRQQHLHN